jgi:AcrR family transcriptional regulator
MSSPPSAGHAKSRQPPSSAELTRTALIRAGLKLFGAKGFEGTSTRDIAALAKANIGSIAYHFGGKEGLRAACADYIVALMRGIANQAIGPDVASAGEAAAGDAAAQLSVALDRMGTFIIARPESGEIVQFVLRELSQPTAALDRIYAGVFEPTHRRLCQLWEEATGELAESEATKIRVFTMIGQIIYFRIAREAVLRRLGWATLGPEQAHAVLSVAQQNLAAVIRASQGSEP